MYNFTIFPIVFVNISTRCFNITNAKFYYYFKWIHKIIHICPHLMIIRLDTNKDLRNFLKTLKNISKKRWSFPKKSLPIACGRIERMFVRTTGRKLFHLAPRILLAAVSCYNPGPRALSSPWGRSVHWKNFAKENICRACQASCINRSTLMEMRLCRTGTDPLMSTPLVLLNRILGFQSNLLER